MPPPPRLVTEQERLQRIAQTGVLVSSTPEFVRDILTSLSVEFGLRICLMTIVGEYFQHILASVGMKTTTTLRDDAFCAYTILEDDVMIVNDTKSDIRFVNNPYVVNEPYIRFYAGAPLMTVDGHRLGSICLLGHEPRSLSKSEQNHLAQTANLISKRLGFLDRLDELSQFTSADLAHMIRMRLGSPETPEMSRLVQALYFRLRISDTKL